MVTAARKDPAVNRKLNPAEGPVLERLAAALGPGGVVPVEPRYLEEPRGRLRGRAAAVLRPRTVDEVATVVAICAAARVGIVPYSGGTGLVGGQIFGEGPLPVILSFERMTRIRDLDPTDNVLVAEAGVVLADVQAAARAAGRLFPLSLASEGSARIGGLLATNAGGIGVLRYGNARDLCLGVEAVLADGRVLHGLSRLLKDNMGYDLRHLLIGAEGTLGLITAASLRLHPLPDETATAWIAVASPAAAVELLQATRAALGGTISAFELMSAEGLAFLAETLPQVPLPPAMPTGWLVLTEAADARGGDIGRRFESALAAALGSGLAVDALIAQSDAAARGLLGRSRGDPDREPPNRRGLEPRHLAAPGAARRASSTRRERRWRPSIPSCASTASAISGTETCTTTSSRRRAATAPSSTRCGIGCARRCTPWRTASAARWRRSTGWVASRPRILSGMAIRGRWRRCGRSSGRWIRREFSIPARCFWRSSEMKRPLLGGGEKGARYPDWRV